MSKAIEVKNLKISYRSIKPVSVKSGLKDLFQRRSQSFEAVRGVSFSVQKGEIVGIVGENGSGKSTLLRAIAGIFSPDKGSIKTFKNRVSLLAIGVGFQKELTGRANIILSGMLLGFTEKEIRKRLKEIIDFSELGDFIDKPVQTYSSGMYSKLAFAITAVLDTDIMLIDEVFSVGDARFKKKSFNKMNELISDDNRTVLIVSHSADTIRRLCDRVIWMHQGEVVASGQTKDVMDAYDAYVQKSRGNEMKAVILNSGLGKRMGDLTDNCHKSMVRLYNGETIFGRQLRVLSECGIREFIVTTGPYEDQLKEEAARFPNIKVIFVRNPDYATTNYIYSLHLARKYIKGNIFMLHGDLVFNKKVVQSILRNAQPNLACVNKEIKKPEKDFKARIQGRFIREISIDIFDRNCFAFQPFYKLDKHLTQVWMDQIAHFVNDKNTGVYAENALNPMLNDNNLNVFSYATDFVEEVDTPEDLERVSKAIKRFDKKEIPIYKGRGSVSWISQILWSENVKRPMLVCGQSFKKLNVQSILDQKNIKPIYFNGFSPNPKYDEIVEGVKLFKAEECDFIISVGGGSAIDVAKCIKLYQSLDADRNYLQQDYQWNAIKHLSVPTTAGTGSESTRYSVIYHQGEKQSVMHESILPEFVILDADLIDSVPEYHKKAAYLDAMGHCIESLWSVHLTRGSRPLSKRGIRMLLDAYEAYFSGDQDIAQSVLEASNYAGQAIHITQTAAAHAFSYKMTSMYGIAHGHAVAICLPHIWRYIIDHAEECIRPKSLEISFKSMCLLFGADDIEGALDNYCKLLDRLDMPVPRMKSDADIDILSGAVNATRLSNSLVPIHEEDIRQIYTNIMTSKD